MKKNESTSPMGGGGGGGLQTPELSAWYSDHLDV